MVESAWQSDPFLANGDFMKTQWRDLRLPEDLCLAAETRFAPQFATVGDLLEFVLRELVNQRAIQLDDAEQKAVEERLRDLGYI